MIMSIAHKKRFDPNNNYNLLGQIGLKGVSICVASFIILSLFSTQAQAYCLDSGYKLDTSALHKIVPHPTDGLVLFAVQDYYAENGLALLKSCDGGERWSATALTTDVFGIIDLVIHPFEPDTLIASTTQGGQISRDGGTNWSPYSIPAKKLTYDSEGNLYAYGDNYLIPNSDPKRVFKEQYGTTTFVQLTTVPALFDVLTTHPNDSAYLHTGGYYSSNAGSSWIRVLTDKRRQDVQYSPLNPSLMLVADEPVLVSYDMGTEWEPLPLQEGAFFLQSRFTGIQTIPDLSDEASFWLTTERCGLFLSSDYGATWQAMTEGLTGTSSQCQFNPSVPHIEDFKINPINPEQMYAVTSDGLFISTDSGKAWHSSNGTDNGNPEPPPQTGYSGSADLELKLSGMPNQYTPPVTLKFQGAITNYGPDTALGITLSIPAKIVETSQGSCNDTGCDFGPLTSGASIQLKFEKYLNNGGHGAVCSGDVYSLSGRVSATTQDPIQANNESTVKSTRQNNSSLISGCPGEGILSNESRSGSSDQWLIGILVMILLFAPVLPKGLLNGHR